MDLGHTVRFEGTLDRMIVVVSVPSPMFATLIPRLRDVRRGKCGPEGRGSDRR